MSDDARFEDGADRPLRLVAADTDDLQVISTLAQDAVFSAGDMRWDRTARRFAVLLRRFRWEDRAAADRQNRPPERVQALLIVDDVRTVASQGIDRAAGDTVLSLLTATFRAEEGGDGAGDVVLTLAGDGALRLQAECLNVTLRDLTRPYLAPSGRVPDHTD